MARRKRDGFYKRDGSPYWWTRDPRDGQRKSTKCKDLEAARLTRARWERAAADPAHAASETAQLGEWTQRFVAWKERTRASATVDVASQKLGHWIRIFGADAALALFAEPSAFDRYMTARRGEGASDHTISKEVAHMLAVLKLAKRAKCFAGDLSTLRPPDLHAGYKPRERTLTRAELAALLSELEPQRAVWVAVGVALGCRLGEVSRMLPTDIDWAEDRVLIRGTKTKASRRYLPILSLYRPLLEAAAPYLPVKPWGKIWRDIGAACKRAGIAHCSTNDFRRTHATLLAEADVSPDVIRRLLGHTTDTLVKQVYARPSAKALATLAEGKLLGAAPLLPEGENENDQLHRGSSRGNSERKVTDERSGGRRDAGDRHPWNDASEQHAAVQGDEARPGSGGRGEPGPGCNTGGRDNVEDFGTVGEAVYASAADTAQPTLSPAEVPEEPASSRPAAWDTPQECRKCGGQVERVRWCFAIPTCYKCLPPPPPLPTVTAERILSDWSTDVTVELSPERKELESSIITGAPGASRTHDLRLRNPLLAGTHADPAEFSGGSPVGSGGFGQIPTGQLVTDVTANWGAS